MPIDWPEPFGLVMIEAMACGTPVIAFNRGSVPEVIEDGVTGFIVEDEAGAIGAVDRLSHLSRTAIRERFEQRFTARRMALDYLAVYRELMGATAPRLRVVSEADAAQRAAVGALKLTLRRLARRASSAGRVSGISSHTAARPNAAIAGEPEERDRAAELVAQIAGKRRADRGADPDRGADDALREIEVSGAARDVGDHQRHHHAERRRRDAVEQLHGDEQLRDR